MIAALLEAPKRLLAGRKRTGIDPPALVHARAAIHHGRCPCCRRNGVLLQGPSAGMSVNVMCRACGARYNLITVLMKLDWTHGPQPHIWGGCTVEETPCPKYVGKVRTCLEE